MSPARTTPKSPNRFDRVSRPRVLAFFSIPLAFLHVLALRGEADAVRFWWGLASIAAAVGFSIDALVRPANAAGGRRLTASLGLLLAWLLLGEVRFTRRFAGGLLDPLFAVLWLGALAFLILSALRVSAARAALASLSASAAALVGLIALSGDRTGEFYTAFDAGGVERSDELGYVQSPYSRFRTYYPTNPRGYFRELSQEERLLRRRWRLASSDLRRCDWKVRNSPETLVCIRSEAASPGLGGGWVAWEQPHLEIHAPGAYQLTLSARAAPPTSIRVHLKRNCEPFEDLVEPVELALGPERRALQLSWRPKSSAADAKLSFAWGLYDGAVEFGDVVLRVDGRVATPARDAQPQVGPYIVEYANNALGYRGPDFAVPRPPGVFRIVLLGDSLTQGVGVHEEDSLAIRLQRRLNESAAASGGATRYEVVNCGMRGLCTREERLHFERRAASYEPQLVVLMMYRNDDRSIFEEGELDDRRRRWLAYWSILFPASIRSYERCGEEVRLLNAFCRSRGVQLAAAYFRYEPLGVLWRSMRRAVDPVLVQGGVPYCDLGDEILRRAAGRDLSVHPVDPHPNDLAHELAAEELESFLRGRRLIPED